MEGIGRVSARCMECEQNVVSDRKSQIWEVTRKYAKRQEMKYAMATGKVTVTEKYCKWQGNIASGRKDKCLGKYSKKQDE